VRVKEAQVQEFFELEKLGRKKARARRGSLEIFLALEF